MDTLKLNISGLVTNSSHINTAQGALRTAKNINIDAPNIASSRRGFSRPGWQISLGSNKRVNALFEIGDDFYCQHDDGTIQKLNSDYSKTVITTDAEIPSTEIGFQSFKAQKTMYFATTKGIKK